MGGGERERRWVSQDEWDVRFEWGPSAVEAVRADVVVVVDVLRFTTAVDAAVARGAVVFPSRCRDPSTAGVAERRGAVLADPSEVSGPSLSPVSLLSLQPHDRIVLPSPNGSTCAAIAADAGAHVVAACLRNATAVAARLNTAPGTVTVVACGERWPDGSLRPALEDYLGSGAVISALGGSRSPEAQAAVDAWLAAEATIGDVLARCASGREALARGWERDLTFAAAVGVSAAVPVLRDGGFIDDPSGPLRAQAPT